MIRRAVSLVAFFLGPAVLLYALLSPGELVNHLLHLDPCSSLRRASILPNRSMTGFMPPSPAADWQ